MDLCQNREHQITFTHSIHSYKNTFNRQTRKKYLAVSLISKSLRFGMAQWTFLKLLQGGNRRKDIWHHKGHIQREQMLWSRSTTDGLIISVKPKESVKAAASAQLYLISILNELASALDKSSCPGLTLEGREIKCLLYADDLLLLSPHEEGAAPKPLRFGEVQ